MINPNVKLATMFIVVLGTVGTTATAFADAPENPQCWGTVTSQAATTEGQEFGEHASDPLDNEDPHDTPRVGIDELQTTTGEGRLALWEWKS